MEQRSPAWFAARLGKITGTKAHNLLSGPATRKTLLVQLFREIALASSKQIPETPAMAEGTRLEPEARAAWELLNCLVPGAVHGFDDYIEHPDEARFCFSPDGLVEHDPRYAVYTDGGIEIKCREPEQHLKRMIYGIEKAELHQCQWGLFVTGREWWDYVAFCPALPPKMQLFTHRITIDEKRREEMWKLGAKLLSDLDAACEKWGVGF